DYRQSALRDAALVDAGASSVVAARIEIGGRCLGAVAALRCDERNPLEPADLRLLLLAAGQLGLVLTAHAARGDHAGALHRATRVAEAVVASGGALTLDGALAAVVDGACRVAGAPLAALLLA